MSPGAEPLVTFDGRWHRLDRVGTNPLPGRAIPIWMGSGARDVSLRRVARLTDGWLPLRQSSEELGPALVRLRGHLAAEGRDPASFGLGLGLSLDDEPGRPDDWRRRLDELRALGATHVTIRAGGADLPIEQQLDRLIAGKRVLDAG